MSINFTKLRAEHVSDRGMAYAENWHNLPEARAFLENYAEGDDDSVLRTIYEDAVLEGWLQSEMDADDFNEQCDPPCVEDVIDAFLEGVGA